MLEKSNEMHPQLPSFFGATWPTSHTFYYDQFMNRTYVENVKNIYWYPYCYIIKDHCQKTCYNYIRKLSIFIKSISFNDFHWFSITFLDKMPFFQAIIKFNDFSRPDLNSKTFPGLYGPWYHYGMDVKKTIQKSMQLHKKRNKIEIIKWHYEKWALTDGPQYISLKEILIFVSKHLVSYPLPWLGSAGLFSVFLFCKWGVALSCILSNL